jgi:ligand-binding sensor domain-containing protein
MRKKFYFSLMLFFSAVSVMAQTRSIENIGLGEISVIELAPNGDVWAGSRGQGIAFYRADSLKWTYYNTSNTPQLKSDTISSIALAIVANVQHSVIGTSSGGVITQIGTWDTLTQVSGTYIRGVVYRADSLWVTTGNSILRYDSSFTHILNYSPPFPGITCQVTGPSICAGFWAGTLNSGCFYTSDGTTFTYVDTSIANKKLVNNHVNAIAVDLACDRIFVGTQGGFSSCPLSGPPCQNFTTSNGLPQNDITAVVLGCGNTVWIGTRDSGVVAYNKQTQQFTRITTANGLSDNHITALACSANCVAYAGSSDGGISQIDSNNIVIRIMSGMKNLYEQNFDAKVFPQPAANQISFLFEREIPNAELHITDVTGRIIASLQLNGSHLTADVAIWESGIYFYSLVSGNRIIKTGKFQILH